MYGLIKSNKEFIVGLNTKEKIVQNIRENTLREVKLHTFLFHSFLGKKWTSHGANKVINFDENSKEQLQAKAMEG